MAFTFRKKARCSAKKLRRFLTVMASEDAEETAPYYADYDGGGEYDDCETFGLISRIMRERNRIPILFTRQGGFSE